MALTSKLERYRPISKLGSGGMATVTLAEDQVLGRQVALKRMTVAGDVRGLSRLRREALIGASLSHPNLVSIYDIIASEDGEQIIVMEYVEGETLNDALDREGKLPIPEALRILGSVATALDAIHEQGIVHRDVKPANILLGTDGSVKLADLGIASVTDRTRITTTGSILGSFRYMAPEQLEDDKSSSAIDVYALSAVAFEVLSGRKARREPNPLALAHAIATQPPPDLRHVWPEAPAAAAEVIRRGMSRDPSLRPSSATGLTGRLRAALLPEATVQFPAPAPPRTPKSPPTAATVPARGPAVSARKPSPPVRPPRPPAIGVPARATGSSDSGRSGSRRGPLVAGLLALVAAAVVLAVILNGGSSTPKRLTTANASRHSTTAARRSRTRARTTGATAGSTGASSAGSTTSAGSTGSTGSTASTGSDGSSGAASSSTSSSAGIPSSVAAAPSSPAARTPVSSVESFYGLAASHRYSEAWALADPTFRAQLAGFPSFESGQAGDRSITFNSENVTRQSDTAATVAVTTTSVRTDGTKHCAGTVELLRAGSSAAWLLHQIHINCS